MPAAARITPRFSRARSRCRRSSACTMRLRLIPAGTPIILDGTTGEVAVNPGQDAFERATRLAARPRATAGSFPHPPAATTPLTTADGVSVRLQANVELLEDLALLREHGAEGVGLYRSEFMLSGRPVDTVTEDSQYALYRSLLEQVAPQPVTIRTFDLDERQLSVRGPERRRSRPGLRGLRLGLARPRSAAHPVARAGPRRRPRPAADHVSFRDRGRRAARGAAAAARRHEGTRHAGAAGGRHGGGAGRGRRRRSDGARGRLPHARHQRSDSVFHWPSIAPTIACRDSTSRYTRRCCG